VQSAFVDGMSAMLWVCAGICLLATILATIFTRGRTPVLAAADSAEKHHNTGESEYA
jgi:hypothetical protein